MLFLWKKDVCFTKKTTSGHDLDLGRVRDLGHGLGLDRVVLVMVLVLVTVVVVTIVVVVVVVIEISKKEDSEKLR